VERFHRTLKNSFRALGQTTAWADQLPFVLLAWRNIPDGKHGTSPAQLLFGSNTSFVNELFFNLAPRNNSQLAAARTLFMETERTPQHHDTQKIFVPKDLATAKFVWLQKETITSLECRYTGPHRLISIDSSNNTARITLHGAERTVNVCKLKPCIHLEDHTPGNNDTTL